MPALDSSQPTAVEQEVLRILWELGRRRARDIRTRLNKAKGTNYSTNAKTRAVMLSKVLAKRDKGIKGKGRLIEIMCRVAIWLTDRRSTRRHNCHHGRAGQF